MGFSSALKLRDVLVNAAHIVGIELICAAHALDLRAPLPPAIGTAAVRKLLRSEVPGPGADREVASMIAAAEAMVRDGRVVITAENSVGTLE